MEISLTTPALLFPAVTLLLLAYTNRFVALAAIIRHLHREHLEKPDRTILGQIRSLRYRIILIRNMQASGVFSLLLCVISMTLIYLNQLAWGGLVFGASLIFLAVSLIISLWEIVISVDAVKMQLHDLERDLGVK
jgi:Protein of unknown function (DUF2721)